MPQAVQMNAGMAVVLFQLLECRLLETLITRVETTAAAIR
jgi:hypothetical protein